MTLPNFQTRLSAKQNADKTYFIFDCKLIYQKLQVYYKRRYFVDEIFLMAKGSSFTNHTTKILHNKNVPSTLPNSF